MKARILIVDDSGLARRTLRNALEELGHTVEEATDGTQGLERFFISRPDLVILDNLMNGIQGIEVLAKLRELDPAARVIVATADIQKSTREQARAAGAAGFINKPIGRQALSEMVAKVLAGEAAWT